MDIWEKDAAEEAFQETREVQVASKEVELSVRNATSLFRFS